MSTDECSPGRAHGEGKWYAQQYASKSFVYTWKNGSVGNCGVFNVQMVWLVKFFNSPAKCVLSMGDPVLLSLSIQHLQHNKPL